MQWIEGRELHLSIFTFEIQIGCGSVGPVTQYVKNRFLPAVFIMLQSESEAASGHFRCGAYGVAMSGYSCKCLPVFSIVKHRRKFVLSRSNVGNIVLVFRHIYQKRSVCSTLKCLPVRVSSLPIMLTPRILFPRQLSLKIYITLQYLLQYRLHFKEPSL